MNRKAFSKFCELLWCNYRSRGWFGEPWELTISVRNETLMRALLPLSLQLAKILAQPHSSALRGLNLEHSSENFMPKDTVKNNGEFGKNN